MSNFSCILASSSPRRKEILKSHGFHINIIPANINETLPSEISPKDAVMYLALKKALWVENNHNVEKEKLIIASDTIVYADEIFGKPNNLEDAKRMISRINGKCHQVITGVALIYSGLTERYCFYDVTDVYCKNMSDKDIDEYIGTSEPYDKAGGYAIQGLFGKYIDHIDGDYENVVGLPYYRIESILKNRSIEQKFSNSFKGK